MSPDRRICQSEHKDKVKQKQSSKGVYVKERENGTKKKWDEDEDVKQINKKDVKRQQRKCQKGARTLTSRLELDGHNNSLLPVHIDRKQGNGASTSGHPSICAMRGRGALFSLCRSVRDWVKVTLN